MDADLVRCTRTGRAATALPHARLQQPCRQSRPVGERSRTGPRAALPRRLCQLDIAAMFRAYRNGSNDQTASADGRGGYGEIMGSRAGWECGLLQRTPNWHFANQAAIALLFSVAGPIVSLPQPIGYQRNWSVAFADEEKEGLGEQARSLERCNNLPPIAAGLTVDVSQHASRNRYHDKTNGDSIGPVVLGVGDPACARLVLGSDWTVAGAGRK
jgi:hypothetical protein